MFPIVSGTKIAQIVCQDNNFDIIHSKSDHCLLNGCQVISSKTDSFMPLSGMLVLSTCIRPNEKVQVTYDPSFSNQLKDLLDVITHSDQAKVEVLESKPDETVNNKPSDFGIPNITNYQAMLKSASECLDQALSLTTALLKIKLPRKMWGVKEVEKILTRSRTDVEDIEQGKEAFEIAAEQSDFKAGQLKTFLEQYKGKKQASCEMVNSMISDFMTMKKIMASYLIACHKLYGINKVSKIHTGYPATWFFDPSVLYNFMEKYEDMSDHLVAAARSESSLIRPLYVWTTGEISNV